MYEVEKRDPKWCVAVKLHAVGYIWRLSIKSMLVLRTGRYAMTYARSVSTARDK